MHRVLADDLYGDLVHCWLLLPDRLVVGHGRRVPDRVLLPRAVGRANAVPGGQGVRSDARLSAADCLVSSRLLLSVGLVVADANAVHGGRILFAGRRVANSVHGRVHVRDHGSGACAVSAVAVRVGHLLPARLVDRHTMHTRLLL